MRTPWNYWNAKIQFSSVFHSALIICLVCNSPSTSFPCFAQRGSSPYCSYFNSNKLGRAADAASMHNISHSQSVFTKVRQSECSPQSLNELSKDVETELSV